MRMASCFALGVTAAALAACGGGGGGGGGAASCTPNTMASMTITAAGVTPINACVLPAGTVSFKNNDTVAHHIVFDVGGCPTLAQIDPGATGSAVFPPVTSQLNCSFHDGAAPTNTAFQGTVAVTLATVSGGGY